MATNPDTKISGVGSDSSGSDVYNPEWLALEDATGGRTVMPEDTVQGRVLFDGMGQALAKQWPPLEEELSITEEVIEPENMRVRIYKPQNTNRDDLPLLLYYHGGGFFSGDLETEDPHCRIYAAKTPCIVVSVEYPLAPDSDMDEIILNGLRSIEWATTHSPPLTTSTQLILGGGSTGACLALQLTYHMVVGSGDTKTITGLLQLQTIGSPAAAIPYAGPHAEKHTSYQEKASGAPFLNNAGQMNVIKIPKMNTSSPYHFPLLSTPGTLSGFPRTYIVTCEHDPYRDDGTVLALRLRDDNGGSTENVREACYRGMPHWFQWFPNLKTTHVMMGETVRGVRWLCGLEELEDNDDGDGGEGGKWKGDWEGRVAVPVPVPVAEMA